MYLFERIKRKLRSVGPLRDKAGSVNPALGQTYYGQFGEDAIFEYFFKWQEIAKPIYLDVGAADPIIVNNTYRLYQRGSRGVLIEPNAECCASLRATRPEDIVLNCAIRTREMPSTVDFYVMSSPMLSTIVRREAHHAEASQAWGAQKIKEVRSIPAITINDVLERHFPDGVDLIDLDIEGLDFEVLQEIDFEKYQPRLVSVEIHGGHYAKREADGGYSYTVPKETFIDFMKTKGYHLFVPIVLNGIFVRD